MTESDQEVCQAFDCGDEAYQVDVADWIRDWIWKKSATWRSNNPTLLAFDKDHPGKLVGYGTWKHVEATASDGTTETQIEIAWFGVHRDYQGAESDTGDRCADRVFATVFAHAMSHQDSASDMPVTLTCHIENERGDRFWRSKGFSEAAQVQELRPDGVPQQYRRMVLGVEPNGDIDH